MYTEIIGDYSIFIGRTCDENDMLYESIYNSYIVSIIKESKDDKDDKDSVKNVLWFHLTDGPSPHGFLIGNNPPKSLIYKTSLLVKKFSKMKKEHNVSVDYIDIEYVKRGKEKGTVDLLKTPSVIKV